MATSDDIGAAVTRIGQDIKALVARRQVHVIAAGETEPPPEAQPGDIVYRRQA